MSTEKETLYTYRCKDEGHSVYRKSKGAQRPCSRCGSEFEFVGEVQRNEGESEQAHHIRALALKKATK